jgi:hypothetical protein
MAIIDNFQREVIHLERPCRCGGCCCPCHLNVLEVQAPPGNVIGYVNELWTCFYPRFDVTDATGTAQFFIHGPLCPCKCYQDDLFPILGADKTSQVGTLTSQWSGCAKECLTDAGNFSVTCKHAIHDCRNHILGLLFTMCLQFQWKHHGNTKRYF